MEDFSEVTDIGIDETSKRGHNYIAVFADFARRKIIFSLRTARNSTTVQWFASDFEMHRGMPEKVRLITCDMSLGFAIVVCSFFSPL